MKLTVKKINGIPFHRVVPETRVEGRLAAEFLRQEKDGVFTDGGQRSRWMKFVDAVDGMRMDMISSKIIKLFNGKVVSGGCFKQSA